MNKYKHPFLQEMEKQRRKLGAIAHGGMDYIGLQISLLP